MANNISIIVAADKQNGIGIHNKLLCHLPDDLKYFKKMTTEHTVVMGRLTYDSIGFPLPNRNNIILSRNNAFEVENCKVIHSIPFLLDFISKKDEVFIIGGESIYRQTIKYASSIYLTSIDNVFEADAFFPILNTEKDWKLVKEKKHEIDEKHKYSFSFLKYERKGSNKHTDISQHLIDF